MLFNQDDRYIINILINKANGLKRFDNKGNVMYLVLSNKHFKRKYNPFKNEIFLTTTIVYISTLLNRKDIASILYQVKLEVQYM